MNNMNETAYNNVRLNEFGQIDVDYYINRGRQLRNQAIANKVIEVSQQVKGLFKPSEVIASNVKAA